MTGVEILSSETIYNTVIPEWCIGIGLFIGIMAMAFMVISYTNECNLAGTIFLLVLVISITICCLGGTDNKNNIKHIEYKITIDDSVSMNEFLDKYEIIDQEGKIYTVKEKE